ncbi:hypothetical protein [Bosea sp. 685]|uniref:DUF6035 family protein n=1 Tax=Bosea sp. 685 TaxID=3080057 RepID=UPI002892C26D|nr:hypothetical protein [Bosea sp. 685]WNJ87941.1 hypothetical protein RMR04_00890 [Bosea sp. 685]
MRELRIPYAIDIENNTNISAADIAALMEDLRSTIRLQATAHVRTRARWPRHFVCPMCRQPVYPHAPSFTGRRHFWSHLPRGSLECPLESKRKLTPDQINGRIFHGRQEGDAHRNLVSLLVRLADADPSVGPVTTGVYERPTDAMRDTFPYGRFPDVQFTCGDSKIVLEAQLATITLHGINGRRAFYDRMGTSLLWVMRNFDPTGALRASVRDIIADQGGLLFSIDNDLIAMSESDGIFRLRAWTYSGEGDDACWGHHIVPIAEAASLARPHRWADVFKGRWLTAYRGCHFFTKGAPDPYDLLREVAYEAGIPDYAPSPAFDCTLGLVRLLISLEAGEVAGSGHPYLISIANSFDQHDGYRALTLVHMAIARWQPALLARSSMQLALKRARHKLQETGAAEWGRKSVIGKMRDVLFPDWVLGSGTAFAADQMSAGLSSPGDGRRSASHARPMP